MTTTPDYLKMIAVLDLFQPDPACRIFEIHHRQLTALCEKVHQQGREAGLEEAAMICARIAGTMETPIGLNTADTCKAAIRNLAKDKP